MNIQEEELKLGSILHKACEKRDLQKFKDHPWGDMKKWFFLLDSGEIYLKAALWVFPRVSKFLTANNLLYRLVIGTDLNRIMTLEQQPIGSKRFMTDEERTDQCKLLKMILKRCDELGLDINGSFENMTPLMTAMSCFNYQAMQILLKHGASYCASTSVYNHLYWFIRSYTTLINSSIHPRKVYADFLQNAPMIVRDIIKSCDESINWLKNGKNPLLNMLVNYPLDDVKELILVLLDNGADIYQKNSQGKTAIEIAQDSKQKDRSRMCAFLNEKGKEFLATKALRGLLILEKNLDASLREPLSFDVLTMVATKAARMSPKEATLFESKLYSKWQEQQRTMREKTKQNSSVSKKSISKASQ